LENVTIAKRRDGSSYRKGGAELQIVYAPSDQEGLAIPNFEHRIMVELGEMRIKLEADGTPNNRMLTERLMYVTAGYISVGLADARPINLWHTMWRAEDNWQ
jgi:hypothetical protein